MDSAGDHQGSEGEYEEMTEEEMQQMLEYRQQLLEQLEQQRALQAQLEQLQQLRAQMEDSAQAENSKESESDEESLSDQDDESQVLESKADMSPSSRPTSANGESDDVSSSQRDEDAPQRGSDEASALGSALRSAAQDEQEGTDDDEPVTQEELQELLSQLGAGGEGALSSEAAQGMLERLAELTAMRERITELRAHQAEQADLLATRDELERRVRELEDAEAAGGAGAPPAEAQPAPGAPSSAGADGATDADMAQANAAELTAELSDDEVRRLLTQRFEMDLSQEEMPPSELRELLALLVHRDALQERLAEQANMLQSLTDQAEALQSQQQPAAAPPAPSAGGVGSAAAPPSVPEETQLGSTQAVATNSGAPNELQLPEGLDPAQAAQLQGYADRLSQLLALKHALEMQLADESGAPAPPQEAPNAGDFLQQFLASAGGAGDEGHRPALHDADESSTPPPNAQQGGGASGEEEPMTDEEARELLAMQEELLSMQRQRNEMMSRLAELRQARDGLAGQLAEAQEMRAAQPLDLSQGAPPRHDGVSTVVAQPPAGGVGAAAGDDSDAYTDDFEDDASSPSAAAAAGASHEAEEDTADMLGQLGEMNSRLDGLLQLVQAAKGGANGQEGPPSEDAMQALMQAMGPLLGAAGGLDALLEDGGEGGNGSSALAASMTKAMFGDLPMGEAISRELQASAAAEQQAVQKQGQQTQQGQAGFVSPPRPRTSRKVSNPSPDVFTDYVTPTGDAPTGFSPARGGAQPSKAAQRPTSARYGRRAGGGARGATRSPQDGTVTPPVAVMDVHDSDAEQGTTVLTLDSRMKEQHGEMSAAVAAAAGARDAAGAARSSASQADAAAAKLRSARAAQAQRVAASDAAAAQDDDAASVASADTAALIASHMRAFAAQLETLPKSVLRNKSLGDALHEATSSAVQSAVQRSKPGSRRVRASRGAAAPREGVQGGPEEETPFGSTPTFGATRAPAGALPPKHGGSRGQRKAGAVKKASRSGRSSGASTATAERRRAAAAAKLRRSQQQRSGSMDASDDGKQHVGGVRRTRPLFPRRIARTRRSGDESLNTSLASAGGDSGPHARKRRATASVGTTKAGVKRRGVGSSSASPEPALGGGRRQSGGGYGSSSAMSSSAGGGSDSEAPPREAYDLSFDADGPFSPGAGWASRDVAQQGDGLQVTVSAAGGERGGVGRALDLVNGVKRTLSDLRQRSPIKGGGQQHAFAATAPAGGAAAATLPRFGSTTALSAASPVISRGHSLRDSQYDFEVTEDAIRSDPSVQAQDAEHEAAAAAAAAAGLGHRLRARTGTEDDSVDTPLHSDEESEDSEAAPRAARAADSYDDDLDWLAPAAKGHGNGSAPGPFGSAGAALLDQHRRRDEEVTYVRNAPRRDRHGRGGLPIPVGGASATATAGIALPPPPGTASQNNALSYTAPPEPPARRSSLDHGSRYRPRGASSGAASDSSGNIWQDAAAAAAAARYGLDDSHDGGYSSQERDVQSLFRLGQLRSNHDDTSRAAGSNRGGWQGGSTPALPDRKEESGSWSWDGPGADSPWGEDSTWDGPAPAQLPGQQWSPPAPRGEGGVAGDSGSVSAWRPGSAGMDDGMSGACSHEAPRAAPAPAAHSPLSAVEAAWRHRAERSAGGAGPRELSADLASDESECESASGSGSSSGSTGSFGGGSHEDVEGGWYEGDDSASSSGSDEASESEQSTTSSEQSGASGFAASNSAVHAPPALHAERRGGAGAWAVAVDASEPLPLSGSSRASLGSTPEHSADGGARRRVDCIAVDVQSPGAEQVRAAAAARRAGAAPLAGGFVSPASVRSQVAATSDSGAPLGSPQQSIDFALSPDGPGDTAHYAATELPAQHAAPAAPLDVDSETLVAAGLQADALRQSLFGSMAHTRRNGSSFSVRSAGSAEQPASASDGGGGDEAQDELRNTLQMLTLMRQDSDHAEQYIRSPDFGRSRAASVEGGSGSAASQPHVDGFVPSRAAPATARGAGGGEDEASKEAQGEVGQYQRFRMVRSADRSSGVEGNPLFQLQPKGGKPNGSPKTVAVDATSTAKSVPPKQSVQATQLTDKGLKVPMSALQAAAAGGGDVDQVAHLNRALLSNAAAMLQQGGDSNPALRMLQQHQHDSDSSEYESD